MTIPARTAVIDVRAIPELSRQEAERIAHQELDAFVRLLEQLEGDDWDQPTACDLWTVRDVVAHQGGHVQAGTNLRGMFAQLSPGVARPYKKRGMNTLDAMNQAQVDMRREWPLDRLVGEIRDRTPEAIDARRRLPFLARIIRVPAPDYGLIRVDYLLHVVFPRDMWIHRLDITDATGRPFDVNPQHDGLLVAHVVRDMNRNVRKRLPGRAIKLTVEGPAGGTWQLGSGDEVAVRMDMLDFMRISSGRMDVANALAAADIGATDRDTRERVLRSLAAVY